MNVLHFKTKKSSFVLYASPVYMCYHNMATCGCVHTGSVTSHQCIASKILYHQYMLFFYTGCHWVDTWWANGVISPSNMSVVD